MRDRDAQFDYKISGKNLKVIANFTPVQGNGKNLSVEEVLSNLESKGVNTGINKEIIERMCQSQKLLRTIILAEAIPPEQGTKARIESYFEIKKKTLI